MNNLVILHLSDLHISGEGSTYSKLLKALLCDIEKQIQSVANNSLVIVVTGDIINAGDKKALSNAKKFFKSLKKVTQEKVAAIYIVPGNHDKKRTDSNAFMVPGYRELIDRSKRISNENSADGVKKTDFGDSFKKSFWTIHEKTYDDSGYFDLMKYVYDDLFCMPDIGVIAKRTYGVHVLSIGQDKYCFVLLNTAWSCADKYDSRNLLLGQFQLDELRRDFHEQTDEDEISMTFVMGHHPIESLHGVEQDALFSTMISYTEICANVYMCGHTHDRSVVNWTNNRHTIHTLTTGFGWPEEPSPRVHDHYYSLYAFNLPLNSLDIYVRKTNDGSEFIPDLSIYTGSQTNNGDRLLRPIKYQEAQGTIQLSTASGIPISTTYASTDFLKDAKRYHEKLTKVAVETGMLLEEGIRDFLDDVRQEGSVDNVNNARQLLRRYLSSKKDQGFSKEEQSFIDSYMARNLDQVYDNFQGYLQRLSQRLRQELISDCSPEKIVRFHFRYLDTSSLLYKALCSSFSSDEVVCQNINQPSDVKYEDLISEAFESNSTGCLIYSVNESVCKKKLREKWSDFITVVPKLEKNRYKRRNNQHSVRQYPLITFGVTTNSREDSYLLYCMDYFKIDEFISCCLERYMDVFKIDIEGFVNWVRKETQESASA